MNRSDEDTTGVVLDRKSLRAQMLSQRMSMTTLEWERSSQQVRQYVAEYLRTHIQPKRGQVIAFCWPIKHEPDLRPLMAEWRQEGGVVALPVVLQVDAPLGFRAWEDSAAMALDQYGIPCPAEGPLLSPDILLLPGNAYDAAGYRLGYGGGFFDRTLAVLDPKPWVIGVCFQDALIPNLYPHAHDFPVDAVVTERGVTTFHPVKSERI